MIARALVLSPNRSYAHDFRNHFQQQVAPSATVDVETDAMRAMQLPMSGYGLIVLDGDLGFFDGTQMMLMLKSHAPTAVYVMVFDGVNDLVRLQALQAGASLVLPRPADDAAWAEMMERLHQTLEPASAAPAATDADGDAAPLREVIATECLSGNSTYIEAARGDGVIGDLFIYQGDLYHAQCPGASGGRAVQEILGWPAAGMQVKTRELRQIPPRTIDTPWRELLDLPAEPEEPAVTAAPEELTQPNEMASEAPAFHTGELPEPRDPTALPQSGLPAQHMTRTGTLIEPGEGFECSAVQSYWNIDLTGHLLGGWNVDNAEDAARLTYHIYRLMAEASVALEIDYFDRLTLYGPRVQQELAADNLGVSHAVFEAEEATQAERDAFVQWCYGQSL